MKYREAKSFIENANWVIIVCGAGLSADSGIATFRGVNSDIGETWPGGESLFHKSLFRDDSNRAWGYIYHKLSVQYNKTPHIGYNILMDLIKGKDSAVFTTNIDGAWLYMAHPLVLEYHGNMRFMQCVNDCNQEIYPIDLSVIQYDYESGCIKGNVPNCEYCGEVMRPNVFFFGDKLFSGVRRFKQQTRYDRFLSGVRLNGVIIEIGCGGSVPTARMHTAQLRKKFDCKVIRINTEERESDFDTCDLFLKGNALSVLNDIIKQKTL